MSFFGKIIRNSIIATFGALMPFAVGGGFLSLTVQPAKGEELTAGAVIDAQNIDSVLDKTFEGHKISSLLPEQLLMQIRREGRKIELSKTRPHHVDPRQAEATKRYAKDVRYNPETQHMENYVAGVPFPQIDLEGDPHAAVKLIWNLMYGAPRPDTYEFPEAIFSLFNENGIYRRQIVNFDRFYYVGRLTEPDRHVVGDGTIFYKEIFRLTYPYDVKGVGTFTIRYTVPRVDDIWAYVRAVRRVRRLSGGAWVDPIGGTDQIKDEIEGFNAHPSWYEGFKLIGKRRVLYIANSLPCWDPKAANDAAIYRCTDLEARPAWNAKGPHEAREVYVVQVLMPGFHPYSTRFIYMDAQSWRPVFMIGYDKKGDLWKWNEFITHQYPDHSLPRNLIPFTAGALFIDLQRRHASFAMVPDLVLNRSTKTDDYFTLTELEAGGR